MMTWSNDHGHIHYVNDGGKDDDGHDADDCDNRSNGNKIDGDGNDDYDVNHDNDTKTTNLITFEVRRKI